MIDLRCGDARVVLATLPDACCDALISDPPAGVSFMGKGWDGHKGGRDQWIAWLAGIMAEARRCVKPGGYALVWALPRTSHWTATALDDGGWRIIDIITHHFGQGFPKGKGQLKPASEHWILCRAPGPLQPLQIDACRLPTSTDDPNRRDHPGRILRPNQVYGPESRSARAPTLQQGRWPPNTLFSHVGGPDGCQPAGVRRVRGAPGGSFQREMTSRGYKGGGLGQRRARDHPAVDRSKPGYSDAEGYESVDAWTCVDGCPIKALDAQAGPRPSSPGSTRGASRHIYGNGAGFTDATAEPIGYRDTSPAVSRFFPTFGPDPQDAVPFRYEPKASRQERNAGCDGLASTRPDAHNLSSNACAGCGRRVKANGSGEKCECGPNRVTIKLPPAANGHPTVKPAALMAWLCTLVTPEGGVVLDCFAGSGSTGVACVREGFGFIGIEMSEEYVAIARARIAHEQEQHAGPLFAGVGMSGAAR